MREIPPVILHGWYKLERGEEYVRGHINYYTRDRRWFSPLISFLIVIIMTTAHGVYYAWLHYPNILSFCFIFFLMLFIIQQSSFLGYIHISNEAQSALTTNKRILLNNRYPSIAPSYLSVPFASISSIEYVREYEKNELMKILYLYKGRTEMAYVKVDSVREYIAEVAPLIRREKEVATAAE